MRIMDFTSLSDFELIATQSQLEVSLNHAVSNMKDSRLIQEIAEDLDRLDKEIKRRHLDV